MDGLTLLAEGKAAGLSVLAQGDRLVIGGPKSANAVALRPLAHKAVVMAALAAGNGDRTQTNPENHGGSIDVQRGRRRRRFPRDPAYLRFGHRGRRGVGQDLSRACPA